MNKVLLIIKREYITRVRKKTFILTTILTPLLIVAIMGASIYFGVKSREKVNIAIIDESGLFQGNLTSDDATTFSFLENEGIEQAKDTYSARGYTGILMIPTFDIENPSGIQYISSKQLGIITASYIEKQLNTVLQNKRMELAGIEKSKLDQIRKNSIELDQLQIGKEGKEERTANAAISYGVGYASSFLIYIVLFIYGTMVMRGVMEEKTSRIAEVIVSSVRPFQLMMGKILGIAAVGLTQFFIWIVLIFTLYTVLLSFVGTDALQQAQQMNQSFPNAGNAGNQEAIAAAMQKFSTTVEGINFPMIIFCFIFYFFGGYLFYAALFAAVGSVVNEDPQDAQSLVFPITLPIILSIIIMINAITNPSSSLAVWASIIPFSSPIVMMARVPFGVPGTVQYWELGLSMILLISGFLFTTWLCAKIYRTGILLYGKKVTWKEMIKWTFRKS